VGAEYGPYLNAFRKQVQAMLQYPMSARRRGLSGKVELEVSIDLAGKVTGVEVVGSSSHEMLDGAAVEAIRAVPPLPFPPGLPARALRVRLPLVFELR
jgi:protein TonB